VAEKTNTHVLLNKDLRDLAKARNLSVSKICNEALEARLAVPDTKEAIIVQRYRLNEEIKALDSKEADLAKIDTIKSRKDLLKDMAADVVALRALWSKNIKGQLRGNAWADAVTSFCQNWDVERAVAVDYAEGRKEVL
jgi:hypothetical protein